jgi:DNA-binding NarL/FixJ family response regulator
MTDHGSSESHNDPSRRPRLVLADDDPFIRASLTALLEHAFECVGAAGDADAAITLVAEHKPDVVILDVNMPGGGARRATREIAALTPETAIVILSGDETVDEVVELLNSGAISYLRKGTEPRMLVEKLRASIDAHLELLRAARHA